MSAYRLGLTGHPAAWAVTCQEALAEVASPGLSTGDDVN